MLTDNWITPRAEQVDAFFPKPTWVLDANHARVIPLKDHTVGHQPDHRRGDPEIPVGL